MSFASHITDTYAKQESSCMHKEIYAKMLQNINKAFEFCIVSGVFQHP